MMDPVVSSKYGKRPLLDMPALHVDSETRLEISSLQPRLQPDFGTLPSLIYRPDGFTMPHPLTAPAVPPAAMAAPVPLYPAHPALPGLYQPPAAYQPPAVLPPNVMNAAPMPPAAAYPALQPPYHQGYYGGAPAAAPPPMMANPYPQAAMIPRTPPVPANFHLEGVLHYGQLTTIHFRDRTSNFQGVPEYLRQELMHTYGKYPLTDIRIVAKNGQYHVYATPRKGEDGGEEDYDSEFGPIDVPEARMIGFNEVRGEPRVLLPARSSRH